MTGRGPSLDAFKIFDLMSRGEGDLVDGVDRQLEYYHALQDFFGAFGNHQIAFGDATSSLAQILPHSREIQSAFQLNGSIDHRNGHIRIAPAHDGIELIYRINDMVQLVAGAQVRELSRARMSFVRDVHPVMMARPPLTRKPAFDPHQEKQPTGPKHKSSPGQHAAETLNEILGGGDILEGNALEERLQNLPPEIRQFIDTGHQTGIAMAGAIAKNHAILHKVLEVYVKTQIELHEVLEGTFKLIGRYNTQLRKRFLKPEGKDNQEPQQSIIIRHPDEEESGAPYTKIKLIDGNPLLTDVLLNLADKIPTAKTVEIREGGRKKTRKEISEYALIEAADCIRALARPEVIQYLKQPKAFFEQAGHAVEAYLTFFTALEAQFKSLIDIHPIDAHGEANPQLEELLQRERGSLLRAARKVTHADFDNIVQTPDETLAENKRQKDHHALRDKLLTTLLKGIEELSIVRIEEPREEIARDLVRQAVEIKGKLDDLLESHSDRQLRKDRKEDNEFYVGRQGQIGRFTFEREATPKVRLEDVKGSSFDEPKKHVNEIIETGEFPRLMRISAPGGKVRSNLLLIGPYGCGKSEFARGICADKRVIGASVSVTSINTAFVHETPNNVKRVYDGAKKLYRESRGDKPVALVLDEFNGWFKSSGLPNGYTDTDMKQIETTLLEVLDGIEDYNGIITIAMTNEPMVIPHGILRRFRYVDIVGELTPPERTEILRMYLEKSMPLHEDVPSHYAAWAEKFEHAPGDVIRKVVDELHLELLPEFIKTNKPLARRLERVLYRRETNNGALTDKDTAYVKAQLERFRRINPDDITHAIDSLLARPVIRTQINDAKALYKEARLLLEEMARPQGSRGYGLSRESRIFSPSDRT